MRCGFRPTICLNQQHRNHRLEPASCGHEGNVGVDIKHSLMFFSEQVFVLLASPSPAMPQTLVTIAVAHHRASSLNATCIVPPLNVLSAALQSQSPIATAPSLQTTLARTVFAKRHVSSSMHHSKRRVPLHCRHMLPDGVGDQNVLGNRGFWGIWTQKCVRRR